MVVYLRDHRGILTLHDPVWLPQKQLVSQYLCHYVSDCGGFMIRPPVSHVCFACTMQMYNTHCVLNSILHMYDFNTYI